MEMSTRKKSPGEIGKGRKEGQIAFEMEKIEKRNLNRNGKTLLLTDRKSVSPSPPTTTTATDCGIVATKKNFAAIYDADS